MSRRATQDELLAYAHQAALRAHDYAASARTEAVRAVLLLAEAGEDDAAMLDRSAALDDVAGFARAVREADLLAQRIWAMKDAAG